MRIFQIDAFTRQPYRGNPAAVCLADSEVPSDWAQRVATEMNLSETAFVYPLDIGEYRLRWFTPTVEVDLCGHATVAAAHALAAAFGVPEKPFRFQTNSGELTAGFTDGQIELNFPSTPVSATEVPEGLEEAIGAKSIWTGRSKFDIFAEVADEKTLRGLAPDIDLLAAYQTRGIIVTALADAGNDYDFVSRFFAPAVGIAEDPVTGSAHCALAPFWVDRLGRNPLRGYQASTRGGQVGVEVVGDRVLLRGEAVTVFSGELAPVALPSG